MYKIVLLGEGGVGKSGWCTARSLLREVLTYKALTTEGIREQTFGNDC